MMLDYCLEGEPEFDRIGDRQGIRDLISQPFSEACHTGETS